MYLNMFNAENYMEILMYLLTPHMLRYEGNLKKTVFKSECRKESSKIRNMRQTCENTNLLKLRLLVVHIELFIDMWLTSQIKYCFGGKWRFQISRPDVRKLGFKISNFEENRMPQG